MTAPGSRVGAPGADPRPGPGREPDVPPPERRGGGGGGGGEAAGLPPGIDAQLLPRHVAIIMDGNSRWAKRRLLPREAGHEAGVKALMEVVKLCSRWGISVLTVFAFSTENWLRPQMEVQFLMNLFEELLQQQVDKMHQEQIKVSFMGNVAMLPASLQSRIADAESLTGGNAGLQLVIAISYSGRQDIVRACRRLAARAAAGALDPEDIGEADVERELGTACVGGGLASPDLLIRTSGEKRISNFLLWQLAYTEVFFSDSLWPDFGEPQLLEALFEYQQRDRRFGRRPEA